MFYSILYFSLIFIITEVLLAFLFSRFTPKVLKNKRHKCDIISIMKGGIERLFLVITLTNGYVHALTFLSALKLGTRLTYTNKNSAIVKAFNNFFLIGNLVSVIVAIIYVGLLKFLLCNNT